MATTDLTFLRQLSRDDVAALTAIAVRRHVARGASILHAGSAGEDLLILLEGRVKLVAYGVEGREVVLAVRGPGELIGEIAAFGSIRRTASAVAVDDVELLSLTASQFRSYLAEHPDAAITLVRMLVGRLWETTQEVIDLATQDSVGRVAKRLVELAAAHGTPVADGVRIDLSLTQDELASWTGATRETVSRALRLMRRLGWISSEGRSITVTDAPALRARCGLSV